MFTYFLLSTKGYKHISDLRNQKRFEIINKHNIVLLKMPLGVKQQCYKCGTIETSLWHSTEAGNLCNSCLEEERTVTTTEKDEKPCRKSTRVTRYCNPKSAPVLVNKPVAPRGKGRRQIFKKTPVKLTFTAATTVTSNFVFHNGSYFQVGDIVSVQDIEGGIYYAQIRGLLTDQYCEKSAALSWLLPTTASPPPAEGFDPQTYIIGPDEELPRKLDAMEFVMHAPSDYFKLKNSPYHPSLIDMSPGFIWTSLRNEIRLREK